MDTETDTSWIKPGAEVVTFTVGRIERYDYVRRTTIARVAKKTFTVEDGDRFNVDTQKRQGGGTWDQPVYCVPADSDKARDALANHRYQVQCQRARNAFARWQQERTRENRLAAIAALQAVDETHA